MWIVGDLDTEEGRRLAEDALSYLSVCYRLTNYVSNKQGEDVASRLGFIHVPNRARAATSGPQLSTLLYQLYMQSALHALKPSDLLDLFHEYDNVKDNLDADGNIQMDGSQRVFEGSALNAFSFAGWGTADTAAAASFWLDVGGSLGEEMGIQSSSPYILMNGRVSCILPK